MRLHGTVMPDQEQSAEHKLRDRLSGSLVIDLSSGMKCSKIQRYTGRSIDVYTVFAPNSFPMKINPIIRRNVIYE